MLPIRDINPVRSRPLVNYALIGANVAMYLVMRGLPPWYEPGLGLVPTRIVADPPGEAFTIFTSMFMHANLAHILGNMWFLWIFGDNIEDNMGHARYLGFYLLGGVVAAAAQVLTNLGSPIPMVGASGAIAAVTGAYVILFPRAPILIVNPVFPTWFLFGITFLVPAWVVAGEFFVMNLFGGLQTLGQSAIGPDGEPVGGVAFFAHLGGFVAGLLLAKPLSAGRRQLDRRAWDGWRPPERLRR
jgi:membrane associated rhomboid family serine protease